LTNIEASLAQARGWRCRGGLRNQVEERSA
jgi:hypothetical protein